VGSELRKTNFSPDELARLTIGYYRRNYIEGLFLSSGIFADPDIVMDRMTEAVRLMRERERFGGYIHIKAIPGCGEKALRRAGLYADRPSANIELPSAPPLLHPGSFPVDALAVDGDPLRGGTRPEPNSRDAWPHACASDRRPKEAPCLRFERRFR
jgi:hypothetical protein